MSELIRLWNEQTDKEKRQFQKLMKKDLDKIEYWETHKVIGDEEAGTSFIVPIITFDFLKEAVTTEGNYNEKSDK